MSGKDLAIIGVTCYRIGYSRWNVPPNPCCVDTRPSAYFSTAGTQMAASGVLRPVIAGRLALGVLRFCP
jgi:hypothetical protein